MPLVKTEAIVLAARPLGDTSKIVVLLTPRRGVVRAVAKGARRPKGRLTGGSVPLRRIEALLYVREGRELAVLSEAQVVWAPRELGADWRRYLSAGRLLETALAVSAEGDNPGADYHLLLNALRLLEGGLDAPLVRLFYLRQLLANHGLWPELDRCAACGGAVEGPLSVDIASGAVYHPEHAPDAVRCLGAGSVRLLAGLHRPAVLRARQSREVVEGALELVEGLAAYHFDLRDRGAGLDARAQALLDRPEDEGPR